MKKMIASALIISLTLALSGCGMIPSLPEMSERDEELITEYAAGLILKHDSKFIKGNLLDEDALAKAENEEKLAREKEREYKKSVEEYLKNKENAKSAKDEEANSDSDSSGGNGEGTGSASTNPSFDNIAAFYGIEGFEVAYTGYELCKSYSDSQMMSVDAAPGKQLLVLNFNVNNVSADTQNFDMFYRKPNFSISIDGAGAVKSQGSLMFDDMISFVGDIGAGDTYPMVMMFEIDENITSIGSLVLNAKNESGRGSMILQ